MRLVKKQKKKKYLYQKYKNLITLGCGLLLAVFLYQFQEFHKVLLSVGSWGYLGAFLAGILYVSSFSAATSVVILLVLAEKLSPIEIAVLAALGSVLGDLFIFRLVKDGLLEEIRPIFDRYGGKHLSTLLHTGYFNWTLPLLGSLLIASPLPDEIGVSLLGISKMSTWKFIAISFILNCMGVFLIVSSSIVLKP